MVASESLRLKKRWPRALGARKPETSPRTQTREKRPSRVFFICRVSSLTLRTARAAGFSPGAGAGLSAGGGFRQGNSGAEGAMGSSGGGGSGRASNDGAAAAGGGGADAGAGGGGGAEVETGG